MASTSFLLNNPRSWIVVLAPLFMFVTFMTFGVLSIFFTSAVLFLSTYAFLLSKQKPELVEKSDPQLVKESSPCTEDLAPEELPHENGSNKKQQQQDCHQWEAPGVLSESETLDQLSTTEDSEVAWPFKDNRNRSSDYSDDGSISDEESLIEIALPGGQYVSHKEEEPKFSFEQSIFQQRSLMELLTEFNEEESLIEIDISMGSIKCTRFEIEA